MDGKIVEDLPRCIRTRRSSKTRLAKSRPPAFRLLFMDVFVTGGTSYIGRALIASLLRDGNVVRVPGAPRILKANSLTGLPGGRGELTRRGASYREQVAPAAHVRSLDRRRASGTWQAAAFARTLESPERIECAVDAAGFAQIRHFIYVWRCSPGAGHAGLCCSSYARKS